MLLNRSAEIRILIAMVALVILFNADYTAINVALVPISKTFNTPISYIQWILSGYTLVWAACSIPGGKLADHMGYKHTLLLGIGIFGIGTLLGGMSFCSWFLILSRVIQAIGAAICLPAVYGIIIEGIDCARQKLAFGLMASAAAIGLIIGPTLSSILIYISNWRFIFFINLPIVFFAFYVFTINYHNRIKKKQGEQLDYLNLFLLIFAIMGIALLLNQVSSWDINSIKTFSVLCTSLSALVFFFATQGQKKPPILRVSLFAIKPYLGSNLLYIVTMFDFVFFLVIFGLYLQNIKNYSIYNTGLLFFCFSGAFGCMSLVTPKLLKKLSIFQVTFVGEVLITTGFIFVSNFADPVSTLKIVFLFLFVGTALGLLFPAFNTKMASCLPKNIVGEGSGIFLMIGLLSSSLFTVSSVMLLNFWMNNQFFYLLKHGSLYLTGSQKSNMAEMLAQVHMSLRSLTKINIYHGEKYIHIFHLSFYYAMHKLAVIGVTLNFFALIIIRATLHKPSYSCIKKVKLNEI